MNKKVQSGKKTADRLLAIAKKAFAEKGFAATTTQEIIARAKVTKGALYHHFPSKEHLFEAVYRAMEDEVSQQIDAATSAVDDPWDKLTAGCIAYLQAFRESARRRVLRFDGPAVLGHDAWAAIDHEYGLHRLTPFISQLIASGVVRAPSAEALARLLTGAMNEATFWIAEHEKPEEAFDLSRRTLLQLLESVKAR